MPRISDQQTAFLKYEIDSNDPRRQKVALQEICRLYRSGYSFSSEGKVNFELTIGGLVVNSSDQKVVRWGLNAIARLGTQANTLQSVQHALRRHETDPEIVASAVSALAALCRGQIPELPGLKNVPPVVQVLSAMQTVPPSLLNVGQIRIDVSNADKEVLKLALIIIGINKDIQNLLHPRFENGDLVRDLGNHDDDIVRQYSVWAVIENNRLNISHLGIPFSDIERQPSNVQSKMLELGAKSLQDPSERHALIIHGCNLPSVEAREGLCRGVINEFYDGLPDVTTQWFDTEESRRVKLLLAEHFARKAAESPTYYEKAVESAEIDREFRERILLGAERSPLYGEITARRDTLTFDLFSGEEDREMRAMLEGIRRQSVLKVLVLNSTPDDQGWIRVDKEAARLQEQLEMVKNPQRNIEIIQRFAVRLDQIQKELLNNRPNILHFSGHGDIGVLAFEDANGNTAVVRAETFGRVVASHKDLECVVLHACYSEEVAKACAKHVGAVVGSVDSVDDRAARHFTYAFYQAIAHGHSYEDAFQMGLVEVELHYPDEAKVYRLLTQ